jgi:hypothetical protein
VTSTHTYVLPVAALIETMKGMRTPVTLRTQLPPHSRVSKEICFAEIVIEAGKLLSCDIKTADNRELHFSLEDAFILLQEFGPLRWQLIASGRRGLSVSTQEMPQVRPLPYPKGAAKRSIPRKVITALPPAQFKTLPQRHKQVFLLIDDRKDGAEIGRLLSMSQDSVESILDELYQLQLITFYEP